MGRLHARNAREAGAELVAAADVAPAAREQFAETFDVATFEDYGEMYDSVGPDGVSVTTPNAFHAPAAVHALDRDVAAYVAKPMADEGVPVVIIQPGIVYGPGDTSDLRPMWRDYLQEDLPVIPRDVDVCWDHVEDTAQAHLLAMEHGKEGEEYIVCGEQRTFVEMFELAEAITGVPAPRSVSPLLFRALAPAMKVAERFVRPPEGFESEFLYRMGGTTWLGDNTKAKRELGLEHRPIEEGLREYLEWELDQLEAEGETSKEPTQEATPDKAV
jgi:nucleoside-diphosphate-sugar epimerase